MEPDVAGVLTAIAADRPDAECLVHGDRRLTWADFIERAGRFAAHLAGAGLGCRTERSRLAAHESGQDHVALYLHNAPEYLEAMVGAFVARAAPFNVNYRYVAEELAGLLADAAPAAIVVHSRFAPTLAPVLAGLPPLRTVVQVPDASGNDLLPGAVWYDDALATAPVDRPLPVTDPDDLYILYTGGTTGRPKGVLWRNGDALVECFGGSATATDAAGFVAEATSPLRALIPAPLMHGAGHWVAMHTWLSGGTVHLPDHADHLDPADVWRVVERERIEFLLIIGDSFARPLLDALDLVDHDLSSLTVLLSGGVALSVRNKAALLAMAPSMVVVDGLGSSEAGGQLVHVSSVHQTSTGTFPAGGHAHVLSADRSHLLAAGDPELGWLAKSGRLALGYLGDAAATAAAYPVVDGRRYAVSGDRAHLLADGTIVVHGRDSATINSGGEKVFAEEVEAAIIDHPAVADCVVAGRPSPRWGSEVVAIVQPVAGTTGDAGAEAALRTAILDTAGQHLARFKLPKAVVFVDEVVRSPSGKADYRWARTVAAGAGTPHP